MVRSYSLVNPQGETHRYVVAINKDASSRGGSKHIHENWRVGDVMTIAGPRNNFELNEKAPGSVFIAGGIGVTPLYCMVTPQRRSTAAIVRFLCVTTMN